MVGVGVGVCVYVVDGSNTVVLKRINYEPWSSGCVIAQH